MRAPRICCGAAPNSATRPDRAAPVDLSLIIMQLFSGIALGAVLLRILGSGVQVAWADVATMAGVGAAVVLLVTAASLPVLWRTMRPEGLRTE